MILVTNIIKGIGYSVNRERLNCSDGSFTALCEYSPFQRDYLPDASYYKMPVKSKKSHFSTKKRMYNE